MGLTFHFFQLIPLIFFIILSVSVYYKKWKISFIVLALMLFSLIFMPVKLTQNNIGVYERNVKFNDIPEKVIVKKQSFNNYQKDNMLQLKQESKNETPE